MTKEEYLKLYITLEDYVRANVTKSRYRHIIGTVNAAVKYALKYGADVDKAKIAAVFHDACKNNVGGLEHGAAAAELIQKKFKVKDPEIILAIKNHTIGRVNPCLLEKVIKLADLLEDGRDYPDVPGLREFEEKQTDIDIVYLALCERQRNLLIQRGVEYDKLTDEVIEWFKQEIENK